MAQRELDSRYVDDLLFLKSRAVPNYRVLVKTTAFHLSAQPCYVISTPPQMSVILRTHTSLVLVCMMCYTSH